MSKTLLLVRHAKAEFDNPYGDHERELTGKGVRAAQALGKRLQGRVEHVDLALVSSATRTQQTYEQLAARLDVARVEVDEQLYFAGVGDMISLVTALPEDAECVLVVGHEPTISGAGHYLAAPCPASSAISFGVSTGTALVLTFEGRWADFGAAELSVVEHGL
ncbi:MAG: phosphohistidine phosphatase SixA [Buchananella hordeovulneris]|nr:phosphohistidine phosphatase SixA [Buchananella hordeovulneris]